MSLNSWVICEFLCNMKMTAFWDVVKCNLIEIGRCFREPDVSIMRVVALLIRNIVKPREKVGNHSFQAPRYLLTSETILQSRKHGVLNIIAVFKLHQTVWCTTACIQGIHRLLDGVIVRYACSEANPCQCCGNIRGNTYTNWSQHVLIYGLKIQ